MSKIERFEDIQAWREARKLMQAIYKLSGSALWAKDFALQNQIRRADISIM